ncbi:FAD-binding oxidoreductase [Leptospira koniambonensis]|uniref:FAD-binding oxidoreductase n=1 Tax=Leptospira koniambonensis TaxID=2484950 RepID=A0A4R9JB75_9LEPT|nr:FAD-binding oxidoreductase [Leptospira koniambonensis]TGL36600.1 FAD-binding oxidoreductase [Leptospira koniambonensis]
MAHSPPFTIPKSALEKWEQILGPDWIRNSNDLGEVWNRTTFYFPVDERTVLYPENSAQLSDCLKVASEYKIPLHVVSTGKNWGYGSSLPPYKSPLLLVLSRMDRILDFDPELGFVAIEPGVTFENLYTFLKDTKYEAPISGTSAKASVVGNLLERGIAKGRYENFAAQAKILEVVLASGKILKFGSDTLQNFIWEENAGPSLNGLFFQSNLGVITRITILLHPSMSLTGRFLFSYTENKIGNFLELIREFLIRTNGNCSLEISNDYRFLSQVEQFPFDIASPSECLSKELVRKKLDPFGISEWFCSITYFANDSEEEQYYRKLISRALADIPSIHHFSDLKMDMRLVPSQEGLRGAYWRKKIEFPKDPDPDRDRCGVLWISPLLPLEKRMIDMAVEIARTIIPSYGLEPMISLRPVGRSLKMLTGIFYDQEEDGADENALQCYRNLKSEFKKAELKFYRSGILDSENEIEMFSLEILKSLKEVLDPNGILSPGKYGIR